MNKKLKLIIIIIVALIIACVITFIIINNSKKKTYTITNDSLQFKTDYESLNGQTNSDGKTYPKVNIKSYNPIKYSSYEEIMNILNGGTGIIYFGFPECPWCRNLVPVLIDSAIDNNVDMIYYLNIRDDRDTKELTKSGKVKTTKKGTDNYTNLVKKLYDYLPEYSGLNDSTIKRIYLPTVVFVKNGKVLGLEQSLESFSKRVDGNPYQEMTEDEKTELTNIFVKYYKSIEA